MGKWYRLPEKKDARQWGRRPQRDGETVDDPPGPGRAYVHLSPWIGFRLMFPVSRTDAHFDFGASSTHAGQLDCRFGVLGRATAEYPHFGGAASESIAYASAVDPAGRLLIAGHSFDARGTLVASIARFRTNGTLDPGFGIRGFVTLPTIVRGGSAWLRHIAVAPDGHILVAFDVKGDDRRTVLLCRLLPGGAIDMDFLDQGAGEIAFLPESTFDTVRGLAMLPNGGVLLLAASHLAGAQDSLLVLMRLLPNGRPDPGFGSKPDGGPSRIACPPDTGRRRPWKLALAPDGGIVVGGDLTAGPDERQIALALLRLDGSGKADGRFGDGGGMVRLARSSNDILRQILVRDDGRILVVAQTSDRGALSVTRCTQFLPTGTIDPAFGRGGEIITALGAQAKCQRPQAACLQPDGKLLLVGTPWADRGGQRVTLTRLLPDGFRDAHFGEGGYVNCGFHSDFERGDAVSVDNAVGVHVCRDSIIVAGHMLEREMKYKFCAVALQA